MDDPSDTSTNNATEETLGKSEAVPATHTADVKEAPPVAVPDKTDPSTSTSTTADDPSESTGSHPPTKMSKNQMKKRKRYEKLQALKKRKKEQAKERKNAKAKAEGRDLDAERKFQQEREQSGEGKKRRDAQWKEKLETSRTNESFQICIDCGFEDLMTFKEQNSLAGQIRYCYAQNRRSENPVRMSVAGLKKDGATYEQMAKVNGFPEQWITRAFTCSEEPLQKMHYKSSSAGNDNRNGDSTANATAETDVDTASTKSDGLSHIVYLTSDAEYTLEHLCDDKVYVIGGIVDRNRLKGTTMEKAKSLGIQTAKLPIEEYLKLVATKVLTVNHVFEILLKYRTHGNDWKKAMLDVLPARKDITELSKGGEGGTGNEKDGA